MGCSQTKPSTDGAALNVVNNDSDTASTTSSPPPKTKDYDNLFKILLIGDAGVGKTSLVTQWVDKQFSDSYLATIGIDFKIKQMEIGGKKVKIQLWDTAGQERYNTLTQSYYRGVHGVAIVFDVCDSSTFENVKKWLKDIDEYTANSKKKVHRVLLGNKCDIAERRTVSKQAAEAFAQTLGIFYFEVSAKSGAGVDECLQQFSKQIFDIHK